MKNKPFRRECYICGIMDSDYVKMHRHHVYQGRGRRQISDRYGAVVDLCERCHSKVHHNADYADYLHRKMQKKLMQENGWTVERFIEIFGKNYLE